MPNTRTFLKSFSSGEISPEMAGRIDDSKYQQGAATMRNFIAKPQGPAENRSGFSFVREVKNSTKQTRLIPFRFNVSQTMGIEMGQEYFRFHTQCLTLQYTDGAAWSSSTNYSIGDIAKHNNVNYYAKTAHSNSTPPNSTNWYALPSDMTYEVPSPYQESELLLAELGIYAETDNPVGADIAAVKSIFINCQLLAPYLINSAGS